MSWLPISRPPMVSTLCRSAFPLPLGRSDLPFHDAYPGPRLHYRLHNACTGSTTPDPVPNSSTGSQLRPPESSTGSTTRAPVPDSASTGTMTQAPDSSPGSTTQALDSSPGSTTQALDLEATWLPDSPPGRPPEFPGLPDPRPPVLSLPPCCLFCAGPARPCVS